MHITILGATGRTGREVVRQALARGHTVTAVARDPAKLAADGAPAGAADGVLSAAADGGRGGAADGPRTAAADRLRVVAADVRETESLTRALAGAEVIVSALGVADGDRPGVLTDGARVVAGAGRVVWLGAFGSGGSARAAGLLTRSMLKAMGDRLTDKVTADGLILAAGGSVFHAGPLSLGSLSPVRRTVGLAEAPHRLFPARVSRATVAAAMLDEAETPRFAGAIAIPLER